MSRTRTAALALLVLAVALSAAPALAGAAARLPTLLTGWDGKYAIKPTSIYFTGDGTGVIGVLRPHGGLSGAGRGSLRWWKWGSQRAYAVGSVWVKDCVPDCVQSTFQAYALNLSATRPRDGHFTRITLHYRFEGRAVTDVRCVPDRGKPPDWGVLLNGACP